MVHKIKNIKQRPDVVSREDVRVYHMAPQSVVAYYRKSS